LTKTVVITGGTRGIGLGLAREFLKRGCAVALCGRDSIQVEAVEQQLTAQYGADCVLGVVCDVSQYDQVQNLWNSAKSKFNSVDIWINNAGISNPMLVLWEQKPEQIHNILDTNILGTIFGSKIAIEGMLKQGSGWLYNMEGAGRRGSVRPGLLLYNTTKGAVTQLTEGLVKETLNTSVRVGYVSPGMVVTDLLIGVVNESHEDMQRAKRAFNVFGDRVETVTPYLVEQILQNKRHGARIEWLTTPKILERLITAPFRKRDILGLEMT
jgi:NADP-dependent 3-hydroxy acid dehydrogenase YdfG